VTRFEVLWWTGWAWLVAWVGAPLALAPWIGFPPALALAVVLAPWTGLAAVATVQRALPDVLPGRYRMFGDAGSVRWAIRGWAPGVFLTVFQPLFFMSRAYQSLALRALGARLGREAWVTSRTVLREPHLVSVGARSLIGEFANIACSYQPRLGVLIVDRVTIGDDVLVGAHAHLGPGCGIGDDVVIGHGCGLGPRVRVGRGSRIGAGSMIHRGATVGCDVRIGKACVVVAHTHVPDGTVVPDHATWGCPPC